MCMQNIIKRYLNMCVHKGGKYKTYYIVCVSLKICKRVCLCVKCVCVLCVCMCVSVCVNVLAHDCIVILNVYKISWEFMCIRWFVYLVCKCAYVYGCRKSLDDKCGPFKI